MSSPGWKARTVACKPFCSRAAKGWPGSSLFHDRPASPLTVAGKAGGRFDKDGGVACDPDGRTSVPGVFVAGDVSRDVQLAIIAAAEGARAALAINKSLVDYA